MAPFPASSRSALRAALVLTVVTGAVATVVAYLGTREAAEPPAARPAARPSAAAGPVVTIVLPHDEPDPPPGPHVTTFVAACTICHSTRLALNQPTFPAQKWAEIVHKMVKVYGAPIAAADEPRIVEYLVSTQRE
jgi:hypothetical protein